MKTPSLLSFPVFCAPYSTAVPFGNNSQWSWSSGHASVRIRAWIVHALKRAHVQIPQLYSHKGPFGRKPLSEKWFPIIHSDTLVLTQHLTGSCTTEGESLSQVPFKVRAKGIKESGRETGDPGLLAVPEAPGLFQDFYTAL